MYVCLSLSLSLPPSLPPSVCVCVCVLYGQVSNSGYTSDNVPGMRIVVNGWDPNTLIYVELHMKENAPSYDIAVVVYQVPKPSTLNPKT
jgi:hypothetical protein